MAAGAIGIFVPRLMATGSRFPPPLTPYPLFHHSMSVGKGVGMRTSIAISLLLAAAGVQAQQGADDCGSERGDRGRRHHAP